MSNTNLENGEIFNGQRSERHVGRMDGCPWPTVHLARFFLGIGDMLSRSRLQNCGSRGGNSQIKILKECQLGKEAGIKPKGQLMPESQSTHLPTDLRASEKCEKPSPVTLGAARGDSETVSAEPNKTVAHTHALTKALKSQPRVFPP